MSESLTTESLEYPREPTLGDTDLYRMDKASSSRLDSLSSASIRQLVTGKSQGDGDRGWRGGLDLVRSLYLWSLERHFATWSEDSGDWGTEMRRVGQAGGGEKKEHLYKILVIGELGTGKTSIIKRYVHQYFSQHYRATIGVDFALKVLNWDADTLIRLQLWDIAGQERFGNMTRVYYKEAVGAFVVFDVTRASTFEAVTKWKNDLDSKVQLPDGSPVPCVLLANKCDQAKEGLVNNASQMDDFCTEKGFIGWYETSAKENINIDEAARFLVTKILKKDQEMRLGDDDKDRDKIIIDGSNAPGKAEKKINCC